MERPDNPARSAGTNQIVQSFIKAGSEQNRTEVLNQSEQCFSLLIGRKQALIKKLKNVFG